VDGSGGLLLRVELDDLELHAAVACLPAGCLVLADLADGIGLLPAESCSRLCLGDGHEMDDHELLLLVSVDVVAGGEERCRHRVLRAVIVHRRERGRHDPPEKEPSPPFP
jgi:hypothetical protein